MPFDRFIAELASQLRLPDLAVNDGGACALQFGEIGVSLVERPGEDAFIARSHLGRLDPANIDPALERLLAACMFSDGASGAAVGVDAQGDLFLTQHFREDGLSAASFVAWLERFVRHAQACRRRLAP